MKRLPALFSGILVALILFAGMIDSARSQTVADVAKAAKDAQGKQDAAAQAARLRATPRPTPAPASAAELKALLDAVKIAANDPAKAGAIRVLAFHLQRGSLTSPEARSFTAQLAPHPTPPMMMRAAPKPTPREFRPTPHR